MKHEKLIKITSSRAVSLVNSRVDALRCNSDKTTSIRAYDNGCIGVAGCIGNADEQALLKKAEQHLSQGIPYPCLLKGGKKRHENNLRVIVANNLFISKVEQLINRLSNKFTNFCFDGKICMENREHIYTNSEGADYLCANSYMEVVLMLRDKRLANIVDLYVNVECAEYDEEKIVESVSRYIAAYENKIEMPSEELPIIISPSITQYMIADIIAERYMSGASIFKDKLGKKIFSDKLSIVADRSYRAHSFVPFFDDEGTIAENDEFSFIKNGVFSGLLATNRSAGTFSIPSSATSQSSFDSVPSFGMAGSAAKITHPSMRELVKKGIYIAITSGGDMTPDGVLGLPVQLAYLYENGEIVARLPEFSLSKSIYQAYGDCLVGVAKEDFTPLCTDEALITKMDIHK